MKPEKSIIINIDKASPLPLYIQLEKGIKKLIENGSFKKLPQPLTDKYLQEELKISRNTVRQALSKLANKGLIIRKRSKGIFLTDDVPSLIHNISNLSFTDSVRKLGKKPSGKTISSEFISAPEEVLKALLLEKSEKVFHIIRLRYIDGKPSSLASQYIPLKIAPTISEDNFTETGKHQSSHYILERVFGQQILKWAEIIKAIRISRKDSKLLEVPSGSPVILMIHIVYSAEGKKIGYNKIILTKDYEIQGMQKKERI